VTSAYVLPRQAVRVAVGAHSRTPASALVPAKTQEARNEDDAGTPRGRQDPHRIPITVTGEGREALGESEETPVRAGARSWRAGTAARPPAATARSSSWSAASRSTRPASREAAGERSGTKTASGSSARRRPRTGWPPKLERSRSGWKPMARGFGRRAPPSSPTTWPLTGSRSASGGRASTRTARVGSARCTRPR
jgi:hypothetical protein